jgi:hypothetical protein
VDLKKSAKHFTVVVYAGSKTVANVGTMQLSEHQWQQEWLDVTFPAKVRMPTLGIRLYGCHEESRFPAVRIPDNDVTIIGESVPCGEALDSQEVFDVLRTKEIYFYRALHWHMYPMLCFVRALPLALGQLTALQLFLVDCNGPVLEGVTQRLTAATLLELSCSEPVGTMTRALLPQHGRLDQARLFFTDLSNIALDVILGAFDVVNATTSVVGGGSPPLVMLTAVGPSCRLDLASNKRNTVCNCLSPPFPGASHCPAVPRLPCSDGKRFIFASQICDGVSQCSSGEDEQFCSATVEMVDATLDIDLLRDGECYKSTTFTLESGRFQSPPRSFIFGVCFEGLGVTTGWLSAEGTQGDTRFR